MAKGIILLEDIPRSCVECPMCYHATDMSIGKFQYERLYRCGLEPEDVEQVYLEDICHKSQIGVLFVFSRKWRTMMIIATMEDTTKVGTIV